MRIYDIRKLSEVRAAIVVLAGCLHVKYIVLIWNAIFIILSATVAVPSCSRIVSCRVRKCIYDEGATGWDEDGWAWWWVVLCQLGESCWTRYHDQNVLSLFTWYFFRKSLRRFFIRYSTSSQCLPLYETKRPQLRNVILILGIITTPSQTFVHISK